MEFSDSSVMLPNHAADTFFEIMQMSSAMAWISDAKGNRTWFNKSWLTFRGRSSDSEKISGWKRGVLPSSLDRLLHVICSAAAIKSPYCLRYELLRQDGTYRDVNEQAIPLLDHTGMLVGYAGTCFATSNIPVIHGSESKELFALEEDCREAVWCIDLNGRITYVNSAIADMLGYPVQDMIGSSFLDYIAEELHSSALEQFTKRQTGTYFSREFQFQKSDGQPLWATVLHSDLRNTESSIVGVKQIVLDITPHVNTERRLREEDLRKKAFFSMVSHELRNPLAPVRHALRIIRLQPRLSPQIDEAREIIDRETQKMSRYLDDLLDIARISSGRMELRLELSDLTICVQRAVESVRNDLIAHSHVLEVTGCDQAIFLRIDPLRIEQILINLLTNAIKYTKFHGHIRVSAERYIQDVEWIAVKVSDTGLGVAPEFMPYLFDMYSRAQHVSSAGVTGAGLGLPLARYLIELHGGTIEAHSAGLGQGSAFVFRLPMDLSGTVAASLPTGGDCESKKPFGLGAD